ncbi:Tat pathway signal sequence domain protein [Streptomyces sp. NPDC057620]|uniref:Tat pathway signal sequence domain protein n=1 Tax=Streptomyces liliiviolaceus TaxID=2823109 RepID=A0A940XTB7_9ACTN|nr:Tat pathway signal sequence domain protein [Streptomyces liliiviolaceus]MBQ0849796.1 Tat pathway signal sequence domain protein [Streptomyces liliiviolaceus]
MSGVGPVEPGEGTRAWDDLEPPPPADHGQPRGHPAALYYARHRRAVLASAATAVLLAGGGYLYATRPQPPPPAVGPFPSQVVDIDYLGQEGSPANAPKGSFTFAVQVTARSGPTITVVEISQPYAGLNLTSVPKPPFRTRTGFSHKIVVTMNVTECANTPRNAGLPFLDVTLRNTRAIEDHSYILGERYAHDLSDALQVACSNDPPSLANR